MNGNDILQADTARQGSPEPQQNATIGPGIRSLPPVSLTRLAFEAWCNVPQDYPSREEHLDKAWDATSDYTRACWERVVDAIGRALALPADPDGVTPA